MLKYLIAWYQQKFLYSLDSKPQGKFFQIKYAKSEALVIIGMLKELISYSKTNSKNNSVEKNILELISKISFDIKISIDDISSVSLNKVENA